MHYPQPCPFNCGTGCSTLTEESVVEPLQQRVNERKVYEEVVDLIVDFVSKEFTHDESARLRVYALIADNFDGMVRALTATKKQLAINSIEYEDIEDE